jgi:hypothetical protein
MHYLIALTLAEPHEAKRSRVLNAALAQLSVHGDVVPIHEEVGLRPPRRADAPGEIFRLLRVRVDGNVDAKVAAEQAANATDAANAALRAIGVRQPVFACYLRPDADDEGDEAEG